MSILTNLRSPPRTKSHVSMSNPKRLSPEECSIIDQGHTYFNDMTLLLNDLPQTPFEGHRMFRFYLHKALSHKGHMSVYSVVHATVHNRWHMRHSVRSGWRPASASDQVSSRIKTCPLDSGRCECGILSHIGAVFQANGNEIGFCCFLAAKESVAGSSPIMLTNEVLSPSQLICANCGWLEEFLHFRNELQLANDSSSERRYFRKCPY